MGFLITYAKKMKNVILILLFMLILSACDETNTSVYTVSDEEFSSATSDSMVIYVESKGGQISMKGNLTLDEGLCTVSLKAPSGDTIFSADTTFVPDTLYSIVSITSTDTIYSIDSIFIADTIFTPDTILQYKYLYTKSFQSGETYTIDEKFDRKIGTWIFKYKISKDGDVAPSGNFDFNIIYYN